MSKLGEFSAADAALTGFRICREHPKAVAIWVALQVVVSLAVKAYIAAVAAPVLNELYALRTHAAAPAELQRLGYEGLTDYLPLAIVFLVLYAVQWAAMCRAVQRPAESRFGYLRLASDELKQFGLLVVLTAMLVALEIVVLAVASMAANLAGARRETGALAIAIPLTLCALVFFGVRFSLASPLTFATGRIDLAGSWRLTQGRFWRLAWAYAMALALAVVVAILSRAIALVGLELVSMALGAHPAAHQSPTVSLAEAFAAPSLIYTVIAAAGGALTWPVVTSPPAAICRALGADAAATKVARAFE
ncbi:MAG: hypothetical protein ACREEW_03970 [Caulobacteraceae bacterium]